MKLTKPFDIHRHKQFKKAVDVLRKGKVIRFYTTEIAERTGESKGNVSSYYRGNIPIGDKFWDAFNAAYAQELERLYLMDKAAKETSEFENIAASPKLNQSEEVYQKKIGRSG